MSQVTCEIVLENDDEFTPEVWEFLAPDVESAESRLSACITEYALTRDGEVSWGEVVSDVLGVPKNREFLARHGLALPPPGRIAVSIERDWHKVVVERPDLDDEEAGKEGEELA
jgi:hypothetical protein